jgi:hypothetical protein
VGQWLENLPVMWMAIVILAVLLVAVALINLAVARLATGARAIAFGSVSSGILPPIGIVFGLLVGFVAAQVWSDFDKARVAVNQEAGALREIVLIAASFGGDTEARLGALVREHIERSVAVEWPEMAAQTATVIVIAVDSVYFQCARAIVRADLWNPARHADQRTLPSPGQILAALSEDRIGGEDYDRAWPERAKQTLW